MLGYPTVDEFIDEVIGLDNPPTHEDYREAIDVGTSHYANGHADTCLAQLRDYSLIETVDGKPVFADRTDLYKHLGVEQADILAFIYAVEQKFNVEIPIREIIKYVLQGTDAETIKDALDLGLVNDSESAMEEFGAPSEESEHPPVSMGRLRDYYAWKLQGMCGA